jgi:hypothetical protein
VEEIPFWIGSGGTFTCAHVFWLLFFCYARLLVDIGAVC